MTAADLENYPPAQTAKEKLGRAAATYDRVQGCGLSAFEGAAMTPAVLKDQINRNFGVRVTAAELGALVRMLDRNNDGEVDCAEFLMMFFKFGREHKSAQLGKRRQRERQLQRREDKRMQHCADKFSGGASSSSRSSRAVSRPPPPSSSSSSSSPSSSSSFSSSSSRVRPSPDTQTDRRFAATATQLEAALTKVAAAAADYDRGGNARAMDALNGPPLRAHELRRVLRQVFGVQLAPAELHAVVAYFDRDGGGTVDGGEFLCAFFKLGRQRKTERLQQQRREEGRRARREREQGAERERRFNARPRVDILWPEEAREAALRRQAAAARAEEEGGQQEEGGFQRFARGASFSEDGFAEDCGGGGDGCFMSFRAGARNMDGSRCSRGLSGLGSATV
jgi:Ca2+-binding EF-hand superfamily protein